MKLQLIKEPDFTHDPLIDYSTRIFMAGSCFVENMGNSLDEYRFFCHRNPFGIMYNPLSLKEMFDCLDAKRVFGTDDIFCHNKLWASPLHHTSFSDYDPNRALQRINESAQQGACALDKAGLIIVTWGSAWIYSRDGRVLANCHKLPQNLLQRRILTFEQCRDAIASVAGRYPDKFIIHTVSPVRHLREGFTDNARSKAVLLGALHEAIQNLPNNRYFPSFEIMIDSLRDYRFYADDLIHPSALALSYIRDCFFDTYLKPEARRQTREIENLLRDLRHRPFRPDSGEALRFYETLLQKLRAFDAAGTGFAAEIRELEKTVSQRDAFDREESL